MYKRILIICVGLLTAVSSVRAAVRLPHILGDGMVLQQHSKTKLWGWDDAGKRVTVTASWSKEKWQCTTGQDGRWEIAIPTPEGGYTSRTITFDDGEKTTLKDVLIGEVWICAGQSNMEMPVKGFENCPIENYNEVVADAVHSHAIHFCKIPSVMSMTPKDDADCQWREVNPGSVGDASATGYFFGRLVSRTIDMPVGLIEANKGGSRVESWLNEENLRKLTDEDLSESGIEKRWKWDYLRSMVWGYGTFCPIGSYTVKGIIFYQGCSNVDRDCDKYAERLKVLVEQWRKQLACGEIPFYFVQIAPFRYSDRGMGIQSALLREQQLKAADIIPNSDIICTNDLVYPWEGGQIHPCQKQQVGERLAFIALNHDYGFEGIRCESSRFKSMEISNDTCYVRLSNDYGGMSRYEDIEGFEVAGEDRVFHKATATHYWKEGNDPHNESISVTSPEVKKPVAVRYCFRDFQMGNLKNQAMLPLFPFRTDNW